MLIAPQKGESLSFICVFDVKMHPVHKKCAPINGKPQSAARFIVASCLFTFRAWFTKIPDSERKIDCTRKPVAFDRCNPHGAFLVDQFPH